MNTIKSLINKIIKFRDERDWKQFHTPKDSAIALALEVAEVLEHFQWRSGKEEKKYIRKNKKEGSRVS